MGIFSDMMNKLTSEETAASSVQPIQEEVKQEAPQTTVPINLDKLAIATAALSIYTAACDGKITLDEFFEVELGIGAINSKAKISDEGPMRLSSRLQQITILHGMKFRITLIIFAQKTLLR